jgi:hypothetical protein
LKYLMEYVYSAPLTRTEVPSSRYLANYTSGKYPTRSELLQQLFEFVSFSL